MWRIFVQISLGQFPSLLVALLIAALIMNSNSMEIGAEGLMLIPRVLKILPPTLHTKGRERMGLYISNTSNIWNIWYDFNFGGAFSGPLLVIHIWIKPLSSINSYLWRHCIVILSSTGKDKSLKYRDSPGKIEILNKQMNESWIIEILSTTRKDSSLKYRTKIKSLK